MISILDFIALILSICIKDRKKSLLIQSLNCILEAIYSFLISAFTGAFLSIINTYKNDIKNRKEAKN